MPLERTAIGDEAASGLEMTPRPGANSLAKDSAVGPVLRADQERVPIGAQVETAFPWGNKQLPGAVTPADPLNPVRTFGEAGSSDRMAPKAINGEPSSRIQGGPELDEARVVQQPSIDHGHAHEHRLKHSQQGPEIMKDPAGKPEKPDGLGAGEIKTPHRGTSFINYMKDFVKENPVLMGVLAGGAAAYLGGGWKGGLIAGAAGLFASKAFGSWDDRGIKADAYDESVRNRIQSQAAARKGKP